MIEELPGRLFISHSYKDVQPLALLRKTLPLNVSPYVFPPITVAPNEFVSSSLLNAISGQDGLIHLLGGHSAKSFWVAFERDYGLRLQMHAPPFRVISFDGARATFHQDDQAPLSIPVYRSYARQDVDRIRVIVDYLEKERHFKIWIDSASLYTDPMESTQRVVKSFLARAGYVVLFWTEMAARSSFIQMEMEWICKFKRNRLLVALLDDIPIPSSLPANPLPWLSPIQLFGDAERSEKNRWDDLVVRLYWLAYNDRELS